MADRASSDYAAGVRSSKVVKAVPSAVTPDAASLAKSTAWSFEHGYLRVLQGGPPLSERLLPLAADRQVTIVPRLLLLCPLDGCLSDAIEDLHEQLTPVGNAESFVATVAGAHGRPYGAHKAFEMSVGEEGGAGQRLLAAVESVASVRTMRIVAEAMAACERPLPVVDTRQLVRQFVADLSAAVARNAALRDLVQLVVYDPARDGEAFAALLAAAQNAVVEPNPPSLPLPVHAPPPVGMGVFMAWSFFSGYLELVSRKRDLAGELAALQRDTALPIALKKMVVLCPVVSVWTETSSSGSAAASADDLTSLDAQLERVQNKSGVDVGSVVPALSGRSFGSFSIYRVRDPHSSSSVGCFALELASALRTLALGMAREGCGAEVYRREARGFVAELRTLLSEHPAVADQFVVLAVEDGAKIHSQLVGLLEASPPQGGTPRRQERRAGVKRRPCSMV